MSYIIPLYDINLLDSNYVCLILTLWMSVYQHLEMWCHNITTSHGIQVDSITQNKNKINLICSQADMFLPF